MKISNEARQKITEIVMNDYLTNNRQAASKKSMTMREMEQLVSDIGQEITDPILESVMQNEKIKIATQKKNCPQCLNALRFEGYRPRTILTRHGSQTFSRSYFRCQSCKYTLYPEDQMWNIIPGKLSPGVAEQACLLASAISFEEASEFLCRLTGLKVSPDTIEKVSEKIGTHIYKQECEASERLSVKADDVSDEADKPFDAQERIYLQVDGSMLNTREDKWKENKLAIAFSEADIKKSGIGDKERITIEKKDFVSSLGEVKENLAKFRDLLHLLAVRVGAFAASEVVVIADGASWIQKTFAKLLPGAIFILDWYHVTEHLWKCAKDLFGEKSSRNKAWVEYYKNLIWDGKIEQALASLLEAAKCSKNQTPLRNLHSYFASRLESMRYDAFRKEGYYIGSGSIESANKYVIQKRLKQAGMKWTFRGANAIAALRIKFLSQSWDRIWEPGGLAFA